MTKPVKKFNLPRKLWNLPEVKFSIYASTNPVACKELKSLVL